MIIHIGLVAPLPPPYGGMAYQAKQCYELFKLEKDIQLSFVQTNALYINRFIGKLKGRQAIFRLLSYIVRLINLMRRVVIHVLANSGWSRQLFAAPVLWIGWLFKTSIIINLERFKLGSSKAINAAPHLVITRNIETIDGIATTINALALLKKTLPEIQLSIVGSGPQLRELQTLVVDLQLEKNVVFTGTLQPDDVAQLYQNADVMLNPTTVDNIPNSILEAMESGISGVTSNVAGIPYIVADNKTALFVEPENAGKMAEKIQLLLNDNQLRIQLITHGLTEVQQYSRWCVRKQWLDFYHSFGKKL